MMKSSLDQQLRSSLRGPRDTKQKNNKGNDADKHVRFACATGDNVHSHLKSASENGMEVSVTQDRKRRSETGTGGVQRHRNNKRNKPNERILRLSQAMESMLYKTNMKAMGKTVERCNEQAESLTDHALSLVESILQNEILGHECQMVACDVSEERAAVEDCRHGQIARVEDTCLRADKLLKDWESCVSVLDGGDVDESSLSQEIDSLITTAETCHQLNDQLAAFHI